MVDPLPSQSIQQQRTPASSVPQSNYYHHHPQRQQYPSFVNHPRQQEQRTGGPYRQFPTPTTSTTPASASSSSSRSTSNVSIRGESALPPPTHDYRFPVPKYVYGLEHLQIRPSAGCTCKKSRCLKLYCQCFSSSTVCGEHCKCGDCRNTELFGKDIEMARRIILQRNPLAFRKRQGSWRPNTTNSIIRPPALIVTPPHYQRPLIGGISQQQQQHHPSYMTYYDYQQQQPQPQNYQSSPPPPPLVSPRKATTTTAPCTTPRPKETDAMIAAIAMTQLGTHHPKTEDTRNTKIRTTTTTTLPTTRLLPKGISFRKICSRCGRSRSDHADAGFGNACTFDTCGKCGKQSHDTMGVQCQSATPEQQAHYDHLLAAWAEANTVKRALQQRHAAV